MHSELEVSPPVVEVEANGTEGVAEVQHSSTIEPTIFTHSRASSGKSSMKIPTSWNCSSTSSKSGRESPSILAALATPINSTIGLTSPPDLAASEAERGYGQRIE
jgi:hypothetical protein